MKRLKQWGAIVCAIVLLITMVPREVVGAADDLVNGNFETGNLNGWSVISGNLKIQPTAGRTEVDFKKEGNYFIGTCEIDGGVARKDFNDQVTGVIQSDPFTINKAYFSFLIGGGNGINDRYIALVRQKDGVELKKATGFNREDMERVDWSVNQYIGETCYIKIVDNATGGWGHINGDYFRQVDTLPVEQQVSLLDTQMGFQPEANKKVILRSYLEEPANNPGGATFQVVRADTEESIYTGTVDYWGETWGSYWWVADFSSVEEEGTYYVTVNPDLRSNDFRIGKEVLLEESLYQVAMGQMDDRLLDGVPGWRDCGGEIRELSSHVVTIHGLVDVYEKVYDTLTPEQQQELLDKIIWGADYIVYSQITSTDPKMNGHFNHDAGRQTNYNTTDYYNWHDMAYGITALVRAYDTIKDVNPAKAASYLESAKKAYTCASYRPYQLQSEFNGVLAGDYAYLQQLARKQYDKFDSWTVPTTLRTKDKLAFLWGCTLLYEATGEIKYKESAIAFADSIMERQFVDYENPIDGSYGNFYEFEKDDEAFLIEFGQNHRWLMGNIEPTNLKGFMDLVRLFPEDERVAKWFNTVKIYGENYVKKTAQLNPFGIYPSAVYPNAGGVSFFKGMLHGGTAIYGQIGKNQLEIGDFLEDEAYQDLASNNIQFVAGLNPGIPNKFNATKWTAKSLIKNVETNSFLGYGGVINPPDGSVMNGFSAFEQFTMPDQGSGIDQPAGILETDGSYDFNEDYLPHSHGYVSGIATLENEFTLKIQTENEGIPVEAQVLIELPESHAYATASDGFIQITELPLKRRGLMKATYNGRTIQRPLTTIASGEVVWNVDFSSYVEMELDVPATIEQGQQTTGQLRITNKGSDAVTVDVKLTGAGVAVTTTSQSMILLAGETLIRELTLVGGQKIMPYLVHGQLLGTNQVARVIGGGFIEEGTPAFDTNIPSWQVYNGQWQDVIGGKEGTKESGDGVLLANENVEDFSYEGNIKVTTNGPNYGSAGTLLFRSKENPFTGTYAVNVQTNGQVSLFKFPYQLIQNYSTPIEVNKIYHLKVTMTGSRIQVFLDGNPIMDVEDTSYSQGRVGLMSYDGTAIYQNIMLEK